MSVNHISTEDFLKKWSDLEKPKGPCPFCGLHTLEKRLLLSGRIWTYCKTCDSPPERRPDLDARVIAHWEKLIPKGKENLNEPL